MSLRTLISTYQQIFHTAAIVRESLYRYTKEDSYEFPSQRVSAIREFIEQLDEQIAANLPDDHDH